MSDRAARRAEAATLTGYRNAWFARSTGTLVIVLSNREAGYDEDLPELAWITLCDDHGHLVHHATRKLAEAHAAAPETWCEPCMEAHRA